MLLKNNVELYDYLVRLSLNLGDRDMLVSSKQLARVCKHAASDGDAFLKDARTVLRKVLDTETRLTPDERGEATEVLRQLDQAFRIHETAKG